MRKIYLYLNDNDLSEIIDMLNEKSIYIYDEGGASLQQVKAISDGLKSFYIGQSGSCNINFTPCFYSAKYLQCASFIMINEDSNFSCIKKHISNNYRLSKDKSYYIGSGIYEDWLEQKVMLPVLFDYSSFSVDEDKIDALLNEISALGYEIKPNKVRLRDANSFDIAAKADSFIISTHSSKLITSTLGKNKISYEYGSDCIFVYKTKGGYMFHLDSRLKSCPISTVTELFDSVKIRF